MTPFELTKKGINTVGPDRMRRNGPPHVYSRHLLNGFGMNESEGGEAKPGRIKH